MRGTYHGKRVMVIAHIRGKRIYLEGETEVVADEELGEVINIRIDFPDAARMGRPCFIMEERLFQEIAKQDGEYGCDYVVELGK